MKRWALAVVPLALTALFALVQSHWTGPHRVYYMLTVLSTVKLLASVGFLRAQSRFRFGEYMHTAWFLLATQMAILAAKDLLFGKLVQLPGLSPELCVHLRATCSIIANAMFIVAMVLMARVWRVAGFELPGSRVTRALATLACILVSTLVVGYGGIENLRRLGHGEGDALVSLASDIGDVVSFSLIAPLVFVAVALRGGILAWPWALMVASELAWMVFDLLFALDNAHHRALVWMGGPITENFRVLACLLASASGLAQARAAVRRKPRGVNSGLHAIDRPDTNPGGGR